MFQQTSFLNNFIALNKVSSRTLRIIFQMFKTLEASCFQKKKKKKKTSCSSKACKILRQFLKLACVCYFVCFWERYFRLILTIFNFLQHCHVCTRIPDFFLLCPSRIPHKMKTLVSSTGSILETLATVTGGLELATLRTGLKATARPWTQKQTCWR